MLTVAVLNSIFTVEASTSAAGCTGGAVDDTDGADGSTGGADGCTDGVEEAGVSDDDADGVDDGAGGSEAETDGADDGLELAGKELVWLSDGCKSFSLEVQPDRKRMLTSMIKTIRVMMFTFFMTLPPFLFAVELVSLIV